MNFVYPLELLSCPLPLVLAHSVTDSFAFLVFVINARLIPTFPPECGNTLSHRTFNSFQMLHFQKTLP